MMSGANFDQREYSKRRRDKYKLAGLCACGRSIEQGLNVRGRPFKSCAACRDRRAEVRKRPPFYKELDAPRKIVTLCKVILNLDAETVRAWQEFCGKFDMPLEVALASSMEMLIAVTEREESRPAVISEEDESQYQLRRA